MPKTEKTKRENIKKVYKDIKKEMDRIIRDDDPAALSSLAASLMIEYDFSGGQS